MYKVGNYEADRMLVVKYNAKDFFGTIQYYEDKRANFSFADLKKAFRFLKSNVQNVISVNHTVMYWKDSEDMTHGVLTMREYDMDGSHNYEEFVCGYEETKKNYYAIYKDI